MKARYFYPKTLLVTLFSFFFSFFALAAATLNDFGYDSMHPFGVETRGQQNLLVVLVEFTGKTPFAHNSAFYNMLIFNRARGNPLYPNVNDYFRSNSHGRFLFKPAISSMSFKLTLPNSAAVADDNLRLATVKEAMMKSGFDFLQFDTNGNKQIETSELSILIIDNMSDISAATRSSTPGCVMPANFSYSLCAGASLAGHQASLVSMAHELTHLLGAKDVYGSKSLNQSVSLMGATIFPDVDNRLTFHLDPWHKLALGWTEARIFDTQFSWAANIQAPSAKVDDSPIILHNPAKGTNEYFMLEYRTNGIAKAYEDSVPGYGLAIWHIQKNTDHTLLIIPDGQGGQVHSDNMLGAPKLTLGSPVFFNGRGATPELKWADGSPTGIKLLFNHSDAAKDTMTILWQNKANLLLDPGFEAQTNRDVIGLPWQVEGTGNKGIDINLGYQHAGINNAFIRTTTGWNALTQYVPISTEKLQYTYTGYIRTSPNVTDGYFGIRRADTNAILSEVKFGSSAQYQKFTVSTEVAGDTVPALRIFAGFWAPNADAWIQIDDLKLTATRILGPIPVPQNTPSYNPALNEVLPVYPLGPIKHD